MTWIKIERRLSIITDEINTGSESDSGPVDHELEEVNLNKSERLQIKMFDQIRKIFYETMQKNREAVNIRDVAKNCEIALNAATETLNLQRDNTLYCRICGAEQPHVVKFTIDEKNIRDEMQNDQEFLVKLLNEVQTSIKNNKPWPIRAEILINAIMEFIVRYRKDTEKFLGKELEDIYIMIESLQHSIFGIKATEKEMAYNKTANDAYFRHLKDITVVYYDLYAIYRTAFIRSNIKTDEAIRKLEDRMDKREHTKNLKIYASGMKKALRKAEE